VTAAALFVVAGTLALVFLGAATAALVLVLGLWVPAWLAAIIVALAAAAAGATAAAVGLKLLRRALVQEPRETAESVRRAATWVRSEVDAAAASGRTSAGAPAP
ncbi:MAG TPA: phage holin family protein, partial [Thermoleophilia bacterium]|nr:phage holin family protein [Thermoleophilia bacterium]